MSLVEDHIHPRHAPEYMLVCENQLVGGNAHMKSVRSFPSMSSLLPLANVAIVRNEFETGQKFLELHLPVL